MLKYCSKCNQEKNLDQFHKNKNRSDGLNGFCKNCIKSYKYSKYYSMHYKTLSGKFSHYKSSAKERNILWKLTYEEFSKFWNNNCLYCNEIISTIGLDRVNNEQGYIMGNVVPCCKICNFSKGNLSIAEWNFYIDCLTYFKESDNYTIIIYNKRIDSIKTQYGNYKRSALRRGLHFEISLEKFSCFSYVPCKFCGVISNTVGIDRINNNLGYLMHNLVSCCKNCNRSKNNLNINQWICWQNKLVSNAKKK